MKRVILIFLVLIMCSCVACRDNTSKNGKSKECSISSQNSEDETEEFEDSSSTEQDETEEFEDSSSTEQDESQTKNPFVGGLVNGGTFKGK